MSRTPRPCLHLVTAALVLLPLVSADAAENPTPNFPPITAEEFDRGIACTDDSDLLPAFRSLQWKLEAMEAAGLASRGALTNENDGRNKLTQYFLPIGPYQVLGQQALGLNWHFGMMPAMTAIFDGPAEPLLNRYRADGYEFRCSNFGDGAVNMCQGKRDATTAAYQLVVAISSGREVAPNGRVMVGCTIMSKRGNPFK